MDPWCGEGKLIDKLGYRMMADLDGASSIVSNYINAAHWVLAASSNPEVNQIWNTIRTIEIPKGNIEDHWIWTLSSTGDFSFKLAYHTIRTQHSAVDWTVIIWPKVHIPKHSCCTYWVVL